MTHIFAFDIDGTLYNSNKEILPSTKQAIASLQQQDEIVMIATGRSRAQARPIIDALQLDSYLVCNGAAAFVHHEMVYQNMVDKALLQDLLHKIEPLNLEMTFVTLDHTYRQKETYSDRLAEAMASFGEPVPPYKPLEEIEEEICQALIFCNEEEEKQLADYNQDFRFVRWHRNAVDVLPHGSSKAHTLVEVAKHFDLPLDHVYAFGDGNNDYEMLKTVGHGVAMGNAVQRTKDIADYVTDTCDHDGIYKALQHYNFL